MAKVSKADYETLAAFRYALRQFLHFSEEAASAVGLTPQQHQALLAIKGYPGRDYVTIGELAERLRVRHHSAVGLVDRLAAQNLVARQNAEADRRQVYVTVTPHGLNLLERLSAVHRAELQRVGPQISQLLSQMGDLEEGESLADQ
jgi:DNA-binding MarR family transcriptional regulator